MYFVKKSFHIPMGHRLSKHEGKCKNIHGHNLKIEVTVKSRVLNHSDMVIDFSILKNEVNDIIDSWDHGMFLNENDMESQNIKTCVLHTFTNDPTAEVLCKYLFDRLKINLKSNYCVMVQSVSIWEADDSQATYTESE